MENLFTHQAIHKPGLSDDLWEKLEEDRSPWEQEREPDLHGFWSEIKRGLFYLIMKLLKCSMRGRSKDFLQERMVG